MTENDNRIIEKLSKTVDLILSGKIGTDICSNIGSSDNQAINNLIEKVTALEQQYKEGTGFILSLSQGKLDIETPRHNSFVAAYKQLHAELCHLRWQIKEIANGDFNQRVSFSGDFSEAINKMIVYLREREVYQNQLKEANLTKDKLFSIISHDLKGPFNSLLEFSDNLLELMNVKHPNTEEEELAATMKNSIAQTYNLIKNLLEWSRLQTGRIVITPANSDLDVIIRLNTNIANVSASRKNISIIYTGTDSYPIKTDEGIVSTILRNLIGNAIKYTKKNGYIFIAVIPIGDFYQIVIKDNGVGIKEEDINKLFRMDVIHSTHGTAREAGTGLGLILCKDLVTMLGGEIWVESTYGQGTTFTFTVPKGKEVKLGKGGKVR